MPSGKPSEAVLDLPESHQSSDLYDDFDFDSTCSTPYVSAPSSPGRPPMINAAGNAAAASLPTGYYFSAPASPMHFFGVSAATATVPLETDFSGNGGRFSSGDFEFTAPAPAMTSADELFLNGQIRPMKPSHTLTPLPDDSEDDDEDLKIQMPAVEESGRGRDLRFKTRSKSHRRTRSMSPMRNSDPVWPDFVKERTDREKKIINDPLTDADPDPSPPVSASSSRRSSRRWMSLKDLLYRSKSEGRGYGKEKLFWPSISFSPGKDKKQPAMTTPTPAAPPPPPSDKEKKKRADSGGKRRIPAPSAHELHYTAKRAQAEELRKKTYLPYRQGLLGCLGFSSRSYSMVNGFARTLHPVSSG